MSAYYRCHVGRCLERATHYVPNYYPARTTRSINQNHYLCEKHAKRWNEVGEQNKIKQWKAVPIEEK